MLKDSISKLLFYKPENDSLLSRIAEAESAILADRITPDISIELLDIVRELIALSSNLGIGGNLWKNYITHIIMTNVNAYTLSREHAESEDDSLAMLAGSDFEVLQGVMSYDFESVNEALPQGMKETILTFALAAPKTGSDIATGERLTSLKNELEKAKDAKDFGKAADNYYRNFGVGLFAVYKAFRILKDDEGKGVVFKPIKHTDSVRMDDLVGYEREKGELIRNTEAFLEGRPSNNVLLYGDSGSGKSTSVKALLNEYYEKGLRIIELYKYQFADISNVLEIIKERNYKFILYIDDLSFEDFEIEYKYLKAIIEGDLEVKPENVLIYATSNRRHLIKETWNDRSDMTHDNDIHRSDTIEEKLSLSSRFGVAINYASPGRAEYHHMVKVLTERLGIEMDEKELFTKADAWEIRHGGVSCRTARQFADYLASNK